MAAANPRKNDKKAVSCPVEATIAAIGGRWKVLVIHRLLDGPRRFGELARALEGVSARTLTRQLRELEACGVVHREVFAQVPPMVEYSLTTAGEQLEPVLMAMQAWGERFGRDETAAAKTRRLRRAPSAPSGKARKEG